MEKIKVIGIENLTLEEKDILNKFAEEYREKIERALKNKTSLSVHIKLHSPTGRRKEYEITVKTISAAKTFESSSNEWKFHLGLLRAFQKIEHEIEHYYRDK